jgi:hypothetical protein
MKEGRRQFIQHTAALAGFAVAGMPGNDMVAEAETKMQKKLIGDIKEE